mmetsp:Transcript_9510/g.27909  ORF Transcript_9510/g.27909 Transcript_9510/m.27909 type:complete len:278 (-) Transcript_9510:1371-2204(-)
MSVCNVRTESVCNPGDARDSVWSVLGDACSSRIASCVARGLACGVACGVVSRISTIRDARDGAVASERWPIVDWARSSSIFKAFWMETGLLSCFFNRRRSFRTRRRASRSTRVFRARLGSSSLSLRRGSAPTIESTFCRKRAVVGSARPSSTSLAATPRCWSLESHCNGARNCPNENQLSMEVTHNAFAPDGTCRASNSIRPSILRADASHLSKPTRPSASSFKSLEQAVPQANLMTDRQSMRFVFAKCRDVTPRRRQSLPEVRGILSVLQGKSQPS